MLLLSGLPRSGTTLLSALLNQNPDIYVTTTSPFVEILWRNNLVWKEENTVGTHNIQEAKIPFLRKLADAYYSELTDKPIIIDKRRHWQCVTNIELYKKVYGELPKIICPVRSVDEIIASYIKIYKKNKLEFGHEGDWEGKFELAYRQLKDCFESGYKDCLLLIEYDDLIDDTANTLGRIYEFMELPEYGHNLNYVFSSEPEASYGINGLHDISHTIGKTGTDSRKILTKEQFNKYYTWNFWRMI
jgi:sulfotransferase